jgi:hypothetical protein
MIIQGSYMHRVVQPRASRRVGQEVDVTDISAELSRVQDAYEQPTLTLLGKTTAPVIVAIFRTLFSRDTLTIPAARLHDQVETRLAELRQTLDSKSIPGRTGRDLCQQWMRDQWLIRTTNDDGTEVYTLTSHTQQALRLVESLMRDRTANLSEHRIATIINHLRRFNAEVNPDRGERITILSEEIDRLSSERGRLLDGGELIEVTDDHLLEGFVEALQLLAGLPGDFTRVVEAFARFRTNTIEDFNREDVTSGQVVDAYLRHADNLGTATPEGRAFTGAFQLLSDDDQLARLRSDIDALLAHPKTTDILNPAERMELRSAVAMINDGLKRVLDQRTRVSAALRDYISRHDVSRNRELAGVLRDLEAELASWMETAGPRKKIPVELIPGRLDVAHLRERFYDPADDAALPPLAEPLAPADVPTLEELRLRGGPSHAQLRDSLDKALATAPGEVTLADVFNTLPDDLRRPVEVFGLLPFIHTHRMTGSGDTEVLEAVRPDGTERRLQVPRYVSTMRSRENEHGDASEADQMTEEKP